MKAVRFLSATALAGFAVIHPAATLAQSTTPERSAEATAAADGDAIIVTGSRIRRPNDDSPVPITTVTGADVFKTGRISVGDILNELPQLRSSVNSQNSTGGLGVRGLNLLDLRGLGTQRTLVLVNGRRHVGSEIINNRNSPDVNTFPTDLIERVDLVTGGVSSIYGSDAIAGVVNFILKDHYDGVQFHGQTGLSRYDDAGNQYASMLAGKNFAGGRGNIAVNLEYSHQSAYYGGDRPNLAENDGFVQVNTLHANQNVRDGIFDRIYLQDIRSTTISLGGQLGIRQPAAGQCGVDKNGSPFTCAFLFQPDGSLIPQTGQRVGIGPNGNFLGGNGYVGREGKLLVLSPELSRYSVNAIGHFEISPAFVPFFEAKYVRTEAFGSQSGPFFSQGQTLGDGIQVAGFNDRSYASGSGTTNGSVNREGIRLDNPYLNGGALATIQGLLLNSVNGNVNPNTGAAFANTAAGRAARTQSINQINAGTYRFSLRRNYLDLGIRDEDIKRDTYRAVVGVRGDFNTNWHYEVSANYGEHDEVNVIQGNVNRQRFLLALDGTRNAAGQIVCRSQIDPAYSGTDRGRNPAVLAADIAACVPVNPFGNGSISDAARRYLTIPTVATGKETQFVAGGFLSGDLGQLFSLPGGPIGFSFGGEYRRETLRYDLDPTTQAGYAFYNAIPTFAAPAFEVKEAFGEVALPLVKDLPLLRELTVTGSGRVASYKGSVGTVYAYSGGVDWAPFRDLRIRASYSRSVRAPYLGELYSSQSQNFAPGFADPCSARAINTGSTTRAANCAAAGLPAGYDYVYSSSLEILSGGNPNLKAETSDSYTLGGVLRPHFIPGLTFSVDYYNIKIKNVIAAVSAQQIANLCYDSATLNNPFCGLFQRAGAAGGPRGEQQFRILEGSLLQSSANFASRRAKGIDTSVSYNRTTSWGNIDLRGVWTHTLTRSNFTNPADPTFETVLINVLNDPQDRFNISADIKIGKVNLGYSFRFIGAQYLNSYEDYNSVNGQPPQNPNYASIIKYPIITYSDIRASLDVTNRFNIYAGATNLFDQNPPYGLTGVGAGSSIYDNRGRYMYVGVTAKF